MKVRKLQRLNNAQEWKDHGYAFENETGQCLFRFNTLVWGRIGAEYNATMKKNGTTLEEVHTVVLIGDRLRWLDIEEIEGDPADIKAELDEACKIPRSQPVSATKSAIA